MTAATGRVLVALSALTAGACVAHRRARRCEKRRSVPPLGALAAASPIVVAVASDCGAAAVAGLASIAIGAVTDLQTGLVFDEVTLIGLCWCLVANALGGAPAFAAALAGASSGWAALAVPYAVTAGRGLGYGDVKLGAVLGAALGPVRALDALAAACVAGALCALPTILRRRRLRDRVAFAPYLAFGAAVATLIPGGLR